MSPLTQEDGVRAFLQPGRSFFRNILICVCVCVEKQNDPAQARDCFFFLSCTTFPKEKQKKYSLSFWLSFRGVHIFLYLILPASVNVCVSFAVVSVSARQWVVVVVCYSRCSIPSCRTDCFSFLGPHTGQLGFLLIIIMTIFFFFSFWLFIYERVTNTKTLPSPVGSM